MYRQGLMTIGVVAPQKQSALSQFWISLLSGVASGIVLFLLFKTVKV